MRTRNITVQGQRKSCIKKIRDIQSSEKLVLKILDTKKHS